MYKRIDLYRYIIYREIHRTLIYKKSDMPFKVKCAIFF